jgi:hypothetical protein
MVHPVVGYAVSSDRCVGSRACPRARARYEGGLSVIHYVARLRALRPALALMLAVPLLITLAAPAAAYTIVSQTGMVGEWYLTDSYDTPGATCGYTQEYPPNHAYFRWMKLRAPNVRAADRDSNVIDQKRVQWFWKLQRGTINGSTWTNVATSSKQTKIAYENQAAAFTSLRVNFNTGTSPQGETVFRAMVIIKFLKNSGAVEGMVKARIDYYRVKNPWSTFTSGQSWCGQLTTSG